MGFTKLDKDMSIIAKLDDEPNDVGGLTAAELKDKFDEGGQALKRYLNEVLLPELAAQTAAAALGAVLDGGETTVQQALDTLRQAGVQAGNVPTGGADGQFLRKQSDGTYDVRWTTLISRVEFSADDWEADGSGGYTMTVPTDRHGRRNANYGCLIRHKAGAVYKTGTWAVMGTQDHWDTDSGGIVLSAGEAYDGCVMFFDEGA